ncbi:MAG: PASTA domain-containing protein [Planctomycetota bacterium]
MPILPNCDGMTKGEAEGVLDQLGFTNVTMEGPSEIVSRTTAKPNYGPGENVPAGNQVVLFCDPH